MEQETKKSEILEAINSFANDTEKRFDKVDQRFDKVESDVSELKSDVGTLKDQMVTKDYLDDKLADLKGDLIILIKKEDKKLGELVEILREKNLLNDDDLKRILGMEPFPKIS